MAKYQDAINDLVWLEKKFSGLMAIVPQLRELANLESVLLTLQSQKDILSKEAAELVEEVAAAKDAIKDQKKDQEALLRKYDKATADAVAAADQKAQSIIAEATSEASRKALAAEKEVERLSKEAVEAKKKLESLVAETAEKQKVLDDLNNKLQKLKESL